MATGADEPANQTMEMTVPKIAKSQPTEVFSRMHEESRAKGEKNDCAVKAVAVVCGVSYEEAHAVLKAKGRKEGQGTAIVTIREAVKAFGKTPRSWGHGEVQDMISRYPGVHKNLKKITTHHPVRFKKVWSEEITDPVLIFTNNHVAAYRDGQLHDWSIGRALRALNVWSITE